MATNGVKLIGPQGFKESSIWRFDEDADLYYPVLSPDDIPESERDLSILAEFTLPSGATASGYVVGISRVFSLGLFCNGRTFHVNKNLKDLSIKQVEQFLSCMGLSDVHAQEVFPLAFKTNINRAEFNEMEGIFNLIE